MVLQAKFSTGVRLPELRSVATVLCHMTGLHPPSRDTNRSCLLLMQWFSANWEMVAPLLPHIQLRDEIGNSIDGTREMADMGILEP
jgi:hypothetical protein